MGVEAGIADDLAIAKSAIRETDEDPRIGWAWAKADYRASSRRAFRGPSGALTISDSGMPAFETAMDTLLRDQRVKVRWRDDDLWTVTLSLLAAASVDDTIDLSSAVLKLIKPTPVRIAAAIANVSWTAGPTSCGPLTIAHLESQDDAEALAESLGLEGVKRKAFASHSQQLLGEFGAYVVATATTDRQEGLAQEDFNRVLEDFIGLVLMLSDQLDSLGLFSLRGATNRPGVRGIALDRTALGDLLQQKGAGELAARVLVMTGWGSGNSFQWIGADPMPLDRLLDGKLLPMLEDLLEAKDAIAQRLRVAARWYARSFWAENDDDAALAVSVALDSMLTGKDAVPGAVSKGRFALLERDPASRAAQFDRYEQVYKVRSAIAHGGDATRALEKIGGARSMLSDARWVARQLLALREVSTPIDDGAFRELWASVQWGTVEWAAPSND